MCGSHDSAEESVGHKPMNEEYFSKILFQPRFIPNNFVCLPAETIFPVLAILKNLEVASIPF